MSHLNRYEVVKLGFRGAEFSSNLPLVFQKVMARRFLPDPYANEIKLKAGRLESFIFIHVPKTAGTSVAEFFGTKARHVPLSRYYARDRDRADKSFKVAIVRDPLDRLHSAFNYLHSAIGLNDSFDVRWASIHLKRFSNFSDFVEALGDPHQNKPLLNYIHFRPQISWILNRPGGDINIDMLCRFEKLDEDIASLSAKLGVEIKLKHTRKPQRPKEKITSISEDCQEIVKDLYQKDYKMLGYV